MTYTLELYDASCIVDAAMLEGSTVIDVQSGTVIGTVQAVSLRAASVTLPDFKTGDASITSTNAQIAVITVTTTANHKKNDGYYVKHIRLAMNQEYHVTIGEYTTQGSCLTLIKEAGEESGS